MSIPLKVSPRFAGRVLLANYCPRCTWYQMRIKKMPFSLGMPGLMFFAEKMEKAYIFAYLKKFKKLPKIFGPFAKCTEPVEFPFRMTAVHEETGVILTAQADMMLRCPDDTIALVDLKTAKKDGGGSIFHPQYELQVIGYSYVAEAANIGEVSLAGLIFCEAQPDRFVEDPLNFASDNQIVMPFVFRPHEVELDYKRLTNCLKEVSRLWEETSPPRGTDNCKDCVLFAQLIDFENQLRARDCLTAKLMPQYYNQFCSNNYFRDMARGTREELAAAQEAELPWGDAGDWWGWDDF